jgi:Domain of unknown function (DUF4124)
MRRTGTFSVITIAMLISSMCLAAQRSPGSYDAFFRCKDAEGQTHYGDAMPPPCVGLDTEVLNERGMVLRVIEGEQTRAARIAREAEEAKARQAREAREQHDRMLLDTFLNVADIERLRDQRMELLSAQYRLTEQNIKNLKQRQERLEAQISRFKPYSDRDNAPPLPEHLAEDMVNTVNSLRVYEQSLAKNRAEQANLKETFAADLQRFKELKGLN